MTEHHEMPRTMRRDARREWSGLVPEQLFARLNGEPVLGGALCALGATLLEAVNPRVLELVALRVSARRHCLYVWTGHCRIALGRPEAGLAVDDIARVAVGAQAFTGEDAQILRAIDALCPRRRREPRVGSGQLLPLLLSTLFYDAVATLMQDAELDAEPVAGLETPAVAARRIAR